MVIQQNKPINIWGGWADKNESVEVRFMNQTKKVKADKLGGKWSLILDAVSYGGPYILEVKGKSNKIVLNNILVGGSLAMFGSVEYGMDCRQGK